MTIEGQVVKSKPAEVSEDMVGKWGKATFSAKRRIVKKASLEVLKNAPSSPHVEKGQKLQGKIIFADDSYWLRPDMTNNVIRLGHGDEFYDPSTGKYYFF